MSDAVMHTEGSGCRVLVVDDDARIREGLCDLLDEEGFTVTGEAENGTRAVIQASELRPDVILMDLRMPGLTGLEATHEVKLRLPLTQVIILSAYDDPGIRQHASASGVYCYLVKGCPPRLITEMVSRAFEHKRGLESRPSDGWPGRGAASPIP